MDKKQISSMENQSENPRKKLHKNQAWTSSGKMPKLINLFGGLYGDRSRASLGAVRQGIKASMKSAIPFIRREEEKSRLLMHQWRTICDKHEWFWKPFRKNKKKWKGKVGQTWRDHTESQRMLLLTSYLSFSAILSRHVHNVIQFIFRTKWSFVIYGQW